jgi:hypothetical protein
VSISLASKVDAGAPESTGVTDSREHHLARRLRVQPLFNQVARPHLDVEGDLLVDLLVNWDTP